MNKGRSIRIALIAFVTLAAILVPVSRADATVVEDTALQSAWYATGIVHSVDMAGDVVYFGGNFAGTRNPAGGGSGQGNNVAAFSRITGDLIHAFDVEADGIVRAIESDGSIVWIGGDFLTVNGQSSPYLAAVDARTGELLPTFVATPNKPVLSFDLAGGQLWVGGSFWKINGQRARRVAALDPSTGTLNTTFDGDANGKVNDVKLSDDGSFLLVGGGYSAIGGAARDSLAMLDPTTGDALSPVFPSYGAYGRAVRSIAISEDGATVYAANHYNNQLTAYHSATGAYYWHQTAYGDGQALAFHDGFVYFGFHDPWPTDYSLRMVRFSQSGAEDYSWRPALDHRKGVYAIDANSDGVAAAGYFKNVNGSARKGVAVWSTEAGSIVNPDLVAPSAPTGFTATTVNANVVKLTWNDDSTDDRFVAGYRVYRDGVRIAEVGDGTYNDWQPVNAALSTYEVRAVDTGGNESATIGLAIAVP